MQFTVWIGCGSICTADPYRSHSSLCALVTAMACFWPASLCSPVCALSPPGSGGLCVEVQWINIHWNRPESTTWWSSSVVCHQLLHPATLWQPWDKLFSRTFLLDEVSLVLSGRRLGCTHYELIPLVCFIFSFLSYPFCTPKTHILGLHLSVCCASLTACS